MLSIIDKRVVKMNVNLFDLDKLEKEFLKNKNQPLTFDFRKKTLEIFNNNNKTPLHYIHNYPGRIYQDIPKLLLSLDELIELNGCLLDPFVGSGTILLEAITNPIIPRNACGIDINPLARLISKVKTTPIDLQQLNESFLKLKKTFFKKTDKDICIPNFTNINRWFSKNTIIKLSKLKHAISNLEVSNEIADFYWLCFSKIIRNVSLADPFIPPPVFLKIEKYKNSPTKFEKLKKIMERNSNPELWSIFNEVVRQNTSKIKILNNHTEIFSRNIKSEIIWDNIKNIRKGKMGVKGRLIKNNAIKIPNNSIDIIITSPPYLTAQKYIRTSKLELLWMDYTEEEIISLDKESIGTERPRERTLESFNINSIDNLINKIKEKSKLRTIQVFDYFNNMKKAIKKMHHLLLKNGYAILIVGENHVLGDKIPTFQLLTDIALDIGFENRLILKDNIKTRSMMTTRNHSGGLIRNEFIIILKKN